MLIVPFAFGQIGNRLQTFSHLLAFAMEHRISLCHLAFTEYAPLFDSTSTVQRVGYALDDAHIVLRLFCRFPFLAKAGCRFKVGERIDIGWDGFQDLESSQGLHLIDRCRANRPTYLIGYAFCASRLVEKHKRAIRNWFTPKDEHVRVAQERLAVLRDSHDVLLGVHVRHGDYAHFRNGAMYYTPEEYGAYMRRAMNLFPGKKVGFLVCTDGNLQRDDFSDLPVWFGPGDLVGDLQSLSSCDYLIAAPSTFSSWASFHGGVPVYRINRKYCEMYACEEEPLELSNFRISQLSYPRKLSGKLEEAKDR